MIELKIPDGLLDLKKRHRDLLKNGIKKALKNFRKAKAMCDKPNPIETDEGTYYPELPINCSLAYDLMVYEDRYCICEKILYRYCKTDKCFKHYLRDTDQWFNIYNIDLLSNYDWWSTKFEAKLIKKLKDSDVKLGDIYEDKSNGNQFILAEKHYRHANNFKLYVTLLPLYPSNIIKTIVSLEDFKRLYKKINPSQERKEMEYEVNENCNKIFTVKEFDREKVYYNKINGLFYRKNSKTDCIEEYFPDMWKEINTPYNDLIKIYFNLAREKTPPRTLKLEDLNKYWVLKGNGVIFKIHSLKKGWVNVYPLEYKEHCLYNSNFTVNDFFDKFREATQTDLDNLTKGN